MKKKRSRALLLYIFMGCLLSLTGMVGTQAFLVKGSDTLVNKILPGNVAVVLSEPDWDPVNGKGLQPGTTVKKNPTVKNTGTLDAWVFVQVQIPKRNIICVDPVTRRKGERKEQEIIQVKISEEWEFMEKEEHEDHTEYIYGYKKLLPAGKSSSSLFDEIRMADYLEGELDPEEIFTIPVETSAVQWNVTEKEQGLKDAYIYAFGGETL